MDMITAYKYSQSTNTKEGQEFLAANKKILLGMNEERENMWLVWQSELLQAQCSRQPKSTCLAGFGGLSKALVQQGTTHSWQGVGGIIWEAFQSPTAMELSQLPRGTAALLCKHIVHCPALQHPCPASTGLERRAGCTKALRDGEAWAAAIGTKLLDTAGNPSRSLPCQVLTAENLSPGN